MLLVAVSLCTPYPAQLLRAWDGLGNSQKVKLKKRVKAKHNIKKPCPIALAKPAPVAPPELKSQHAILPSHPWSPEGAFVMPAIALPPFPPALPERTEAGNYEHLATMSRGVNIKSNVNFRPAGKASVARKNPRSFVVRVSLDISLPKAADGKGLLEVNPALAKVLPKYECLMKDSAVSKWYHSLYLHKQNRVRKNASTLSRLLDRHNFFDTDTILEIKDPDSKRRLLWFQSDMDVVSDGSDGDRMPTMRKDILESDYYQPTTSYRWLKRSATPNPLLPYWEGRLAKLRKNRGSASAIDFAERTIFDLKKHSFLLADYDPFIVIPLTFREGRSLYKPAPGDYAVVIVGKKVYPAIVGDYGPNFKTGEASLRLSQEINPRATVYSRPISDLQASYLVFPGTREVESGPINYERLYTRCNELLEEIGGLGAGIRLHPMVDKLAPKNGNRRR